MGNQWVGQSFCSIEAKKVAVLPKEQARLNFSEEKPKQNRRDRVCR